MKSEYIKLTPPEQAFGENNLLEAQASILNVLKRYQELKRLRKKELFLKLELKKITGEAKDFLIDCEKLLPESRFDEEQKHKAQLRKEIYTQISKEQEQTPKEKQKKLSIEEELEQIRRKLERLQNN